MSKPINLYGSTSNLHHFKNKPLGIITTKTEVDSLSQKELDSSDNNEYLELTLLLKFILYSDGDPIHVIKTSRKYKMTRQELLDKKQFIELFNKQHDELLYVAKNDDYIKQIVRLDISSVSDHQKLEDQCLDQLEKLYSDLRN